MNKVTFEHNKNLALNPLGQMALGVLVGLGLALPVQAQLEEVIVTATKREQSIQDVPISITALSGEYTEKILAGGKDIRGLSGKAPSLIIESDFGRVFPRFYIRGIGNTDFDQNASQPVSLIYDDIVYENPMLKGFPIFDVDRIEVLRGPQGTLFGRNTPAGIVKIDSIKPGEEFNGWIKAGVGNLDVTDLQGAVGGTIGDSWSARASFLHQTRGDWVENKASDIDPIYADLDDKDFLEGHTEYAWRLQLAYEGEKFGALFNVHGRDLDGTATLFRANIIKPGTNSFEDFYDRDVVNFDGKNEQTLESYGGLAKLTWDVGDYTITSITSYEQVETFSRADVEGGIGAVFLPPSGPGFIPFPAQTADGIPDHDQFTQELRINNTPDGGLFWQAGLFYFDEHLEVDSFDYADRSDDWVGFAHQDQDTEAYAIFGQFDWDMTERLILTVGARWSNDEKDYVAFRTTDLFGVPELGPLPPVKVKVEDDELSGNISLNYTVSDDVSVYGRYATGFRAPSIQGRVLFGNAVTVADSETIDSFEVGVKSELFDGRVRLNATIYMLEMSDQQVTAGSGEANANQLLNVDTTDGQGVEMDLNWAVTDNFLVTWGVSYNDTEIDDAGLSVLPCGAPCTVLDPVGSFPGSVSIDGNTLPRAPEWISNLVLRYNIQTASGEWYIQADAAYRDEISFFLYDSKEFHGDALTEIGLNMGYMTESWEFSLYGRNITDEDELVAAIDFNNLEGIVNDPFTYGAEFTYRF